MRGAEVVTIKRPGPRRRRECPARPQERGTSAREPLSTQPRGGKKPRAQLATTTDARPFRTAHRGPRGGDFKACQQGGQEFRIDRLDKVMREASLPRAAPAAFLT